MPTETPEADPRMFAHHAWLLPLGSKKAVLNAFILRLPASSISSVCVFGSSNFSASASSYFTALWRNFQAIVTNRKLAAGIPLVAVFLLPGFSSSAVAQGAPPLQTLRNHVPSLVSGRVARYVGALPEDRKIELSIVLPLRNQDQLKELLTRLYDPGSPDYHKFLSVEEFTAQFGPTEDDFQEVVDVATANGLRVTGQPKNRLVVPVEGTVGQVNQAFNVVLNEYQHPTEDRIFFSTDRDPTFAVRAQIAHIDGLDNLYLPHAMNAISAAGTSMAAVNGSGPGGSYLGSDMRAAYYGGTTLTGINQTVALVEFGGYLKSDVDLNFSGAGQTYSVPVTNILVAGATNTVNGEDGEQVLDIVQAIGMAPALSAVEVYIGNPQSTSAPVSVLNQIATDNLSKAD